MHSATSLRLALLVLTLASFTQSARAQEHSTEVQTELGAAYGPPPPAIDYVARIRFEGAIGVEYLVGLHSGEVHAGPQLRLGLAFPITRQLDLTLHARGSLALDVASPGSEVRTPPVCSSGYFFSSCSSDEDYVSTAGGDAGVRAHFLLGFDAENAALVTLAGGLSYTYFANAYENVAESQGLGTYARVGITYQRGRRFRVGLELGGRATYDFTFGGPWLEANLQVSMSRHF
jgi:hypothetical protein